VLVSVEFVERKVEENRSGAAAARGGLGLAGTA
jgi:hypothetical protein